MATLEHCLFCFETLAAKLENRTSLSLKDVQDSYAEYIPTLSASPTQDSASSTRITDTEARYPLFVTWDQQQPNSSSTYHLRGCIGTFSDNQTLSSCLADYAKTAALHDTRFHPITKPELPTLQCAVTLLTDFESCDDMEDWVVGEHGIKIRFRVGGELYSATYLPSVAPEQGWGKEETLQSLMRKAGWSGSRASWRKVAEQGDMSVVRYRGDKKELKYAEFKSWRDWVNATWKKEG